MEDPERSEVSLAIDYVDADAGMVDADADADPTPETGPTAVSSIPDLSAIDRGQLRRLPESEVRLIEQHGQLYSDIFRKLQLKPGKYFDFWNGVLRVLRSNHLDEIQRGTASVYKQFSNRLLRGYGTIVWVSQGDEWLIDAADLDEGEDRLTYRKPRATRPASDVSENDRYVPTRSLLMAHWT